MEEFFTYLTPECGERVPPRVTTWYAEHLATRPPEVDFAVVGEIEQTLRATGFYTEPTWAEFPNLIADIRDETLSEQRRMVKFDMLFSRIYNLVAVDRARRLEPLVALCYNAVGR